MSNIEAPKEIKELAVIIMGSGGDEAHADKVAAVFEKFGIDYVKRVGSAHKTDRHVTKIVDQYDSLQDRRIAYITIAGRSDALSAFVARKTVNPVTGTPPYSEKFGGMDILSSLRVPSAVGNATTSEPEAAALHTLSIFALSNRQLRIALRGYQIETQADVITADTKMREQNRSRGIPDNAI